MPNLDLNLNGIADQDSRDNFKRIQDFVNDQGLTSKSFQPIEIYVTGNISGLKIAHGLGSVPLDAIVSRLIAPSAARLVFTYSDFTKSEVFVNVTGLAAGENLSARFLVGTFPNVVTVGDVVRTSIDTQQVRGKF